MKQTRVKYKKVSEGNIIKIINIKNVASKSELEYEFGKELTNRYLRDAVNDPDDGPAYVSRFSKAAGQWEVQIYFKYPSGGSMFMKPGVTMPNSHFSKAITTMKEAGDRLLHLKKKQREKIKEIVI